MRRLWLVLLAVAVCRCSVAQLDALGPAPDLLTSATTETMTELVTAACRVWRWDSDGCTSYAVTAINQGGGSDAAKAAHLRTLAMYGSKPPQLWMASTGALRRLMMRAAADSLTDTGKAIIASGNNLKTWGLRFKEGATTASVVVAVPRSE